MQFAPFICSFSLFSFLWRVDRISSRRTASAGLWSSTLEPLRHLLRTALWVLLSDRMNCHKIRIDSSMISTSFTLVMAFLLLTHCLSFFFSFKLSSRITGTCRRFRRTQRVLT
uniref:Uncharacterized protein n=1 Tax=Opuntia streptacantha TaxID=393608 RepID=A0A7C8Z9W3_OPUST